MFPRFLMTLLAFITILFTVHAAPARVVTRNASPEVESFDGLTALFGRTVPSFACHFGGIRCTREGEAGSEISSPIVTHIFGRRVGPSICSYPGTQCVRSTGDASTLQARWKPWSSCGPPGITCAFEDLAVSEGSTEEQDNSIEGRWKPWSSCGPPGITCADEVESDTVDSASEVTQDTQDTVEGRWKPWSSCGPRGITCADEVESDTGDSAFTELAQDTQDTIEGRWKPWSSCGPPGITCADEVSEGAERDIPWAPSTLATYGMPAPTST
ncbi:hypothetical protein AMS68_004488 [Peltaster fructicola]|uniref:Uncharacterized protein n=1 Tax=Peltaster fructicola TaxID=286661 RepID=A0A6H0XWD0_9PEZI|nr:hypothetical protein AMS68_004488 [Peltaster fructicola]